MARNKRFGGKKAKPFTKAAAAKGGRKSRPPAKRKK